MYRRVLYGCALSVMLSLPGLVSLNSSQEAGAQQVAANSAESSTQIKNLQLIPEGDEFKLEIETDGSSRPQVFFTQRGNAWIGDITNARLAMANGQSAVREANPAPGVVQLEAQQIGEDSVRVAITGESAAPQGLLSERNDTKMVFDFEALPQSGAQSAASQDPTALAAPQTVAQAPAATQPATSQSGQDPTTVPPAPAPLDTAGSVPTSTTAQSVQDPVVVSQVPPVSDLNQPQVEVLIDQEAAQLRSTAVAPPTGDIAVGTIIPDPPSVDLGSTNTITLTLKDAPVADVLSLLVRRAGLNVVLNDIGNDVTVSLDVQDAPLQETFDFILRLKELQAHRREQTVFIGTTLPGISGRVMRTFRLNQASVEDRTLDQVGFADLTDEALIPLRRISIRPALEALVVEGGPLEGVNLSFDVRTNSVTAIGTPYQLDILAARIAQLDVRQRQVLFNVRLVELSLDDTVSLGVDIGGTSGNFALSGVEGAGDFGGQPIDQPAGSSVPQIGTGNSTNLDGSPSAAGNESFTFNTLNRLRDALAIRIDAAVDSGTGKILADPKLVVADGGQSVVNIGQQVIINQRLITDPATGQTSVEFVFGTAGVVLSLLNVRIDDNGFVTTDINPLVSSPADVINLADGSQITLLNVRALSSQQIRFRDGETVVLSGLIQETDTVTVDKVPLLGDIPLLGSLFRRQLTSNERTEIVLLITPTILRDGVDGTSGTPVSQIQ